MIGWTTVPGGLRCGSQRRLSQRHASPRYEWGRTPGRSSVEANGGGGDVVGRAVGDTLGVGVDEGSAMTEAVADGRAVGVG